jgi:hypothetical protein
MSHNKNASDPLLIDVGEVEELRTLIFASHHPDDLDENELLKEDTTPKERLEIIEEWHQACREFDEVQRLDAAQLALKLRPFLGPDSLRKAKQLINGALTVSHEPFVNAETASHYGFTLLYTVAIMRGRSDLIHIDALFRLAWQVFGECAEQDIYAKDMLNPCRAAEHAFEMLAEIMAVSFRENPSRDRRGEDVLKSLQANIADRREERLKKLRDRNRPKEQIEAYKKLMASNPNMKPTAACTIIHERFGGALSVRRLLTLTQDFRKS